MSVKAKTASENQSISCAYYYYSLQTLTIWFNHSNMIVHTWAKHYKEDCFSYSISGFWLSHHCQMWLSLIRKVQEPAVCFRKDATWMKIPASKCHRNMISRWYVKQQRSYCRPRIHKITKDYYFFLHSNHYYVNSEFTKAGWITLAPLKIDKRDKLLRVNVLSDAERLFGVTPKETCSENNVILHKKSDWGLQSSQKRNNSTSLDSSPV